MTGSAALNGSSDSVPTPPAPKGPRPYRPAVRKIRTEGTAAVSTVRPRSVMVTVTGPRPQSWWWKAAAFPFANRTRTVLVWTLGLVAVGVAGFHMYVNRDRAEPQPQPTAVATQAAAVTVETPAPVAPPPTSAVTPNEVRARKIKDVRVNLARIGQALKAYAQEKGMLPEVLSRDLRELAPYGATSANLKPFDGGWMESYERTESPDRTVETVTMEAKPTHMDQVLTYTVTYIHSP